MDTRLTVILVDGRGYDVDLIAVPQNVDAILTVAESYVTLWHRGKGYSRVNGGNKISHLDMSLRTCNASWTFQWIMIFYSMTSIAHNLYDTIFWPNFLMHIKYLLLHSSIRKRLLWTQHLNLHALLKQIHTESPQLSNMILPRYFSSFNGAEFHLGAIMVSTKLGTRHKDYQDNLQISQQHHVWYMK